MANGWNIYRELAKSITCTAKKSGTQVKIYVQLGDHVSMTDIHFPKLIKLGGGEFSFSAPDL